MKDSPEQIKVHYSAYRFPGSRDESGILRYDIPELLTRLVRSSARRRSTSFICWTVAMNLEEIGDVIEVT
jgi:hypothetical protein